MEETKEELIIEVKEDKVIQCDYKEIPEDDDFFIDYETYELED